MSLVTPQSLLTGARKQGYAIPAFSAYNLETVQAVVEVAEELDAPVFIQTTPATMRSSGVKYILGLVKTAAEEANVPIVLHLDHGQSYEQVIECLRNGYTSVMIDGSALPLEDNIRIVKQVVDAAHVVGVAVEAELGRVGGVEDDVRVDDAEANYTNPKEASYFVSKTNVDSLAVAIGTAHGWYKGEPKLDLNRLSEIASLVQLPLVLHGASGVPDSSVRASIQQGISKFNIATEIKMPFTNALKQYFAQHPDDNDPRMYLSVAKQAYQEVVRKKIHLSGAAGKGHS